MSGLDIIYPVANRRAFTELTFEMLIRNTNWSLVDHLIVYDDRSIDGAREEVTTRIDRVPVPVEIRDHDWGSAVAVMNDYVKRTKSTLFAKVDNDLVVPPGWLDALVSVMDREPSIVLLGMESPFMGPPPADFDGVYTCTPWRHIGGNGLMRTGFFKTTGPMDYEAHHGFTGHQWRQDPERGWISPDLLCCLLDRCPLEPWVSLSEEYIKRGWQRRWGKFSDSFSIYYSWFTDKEEEPA